MYITCEWHKNFPPPDPQQAANQVKHLYKCGRAVSIIALANPIKKRELRGGSARQNRF